MPDTSHNHPAGPRPAPSPCLCGCGGTVAQCLCVEEDFPGVVQVCARQWNCTPEEVSGHSRAFRVVCARHLAMAVIREINVPSYKTLGAFFHVDHTAAMHACRKMENELRLRPDSRQSRLFRSLCALLAPARTAP